MPKNILDILIIILLIIILLKTCKGGKDDSGIQVFRDTVWIKKDSTILSKPQVVNTIPYAVPIDRWNTEYLPDTNYDKLIKQYELLVRELLAKNIHSDSIKIDSIGHVYITDTVTKNLITGRSTHYSLKYPVITNTITIPEPKRTQWYVGGTIQGEQGTIINQINANLLIKNKRDQMFGGHVGLNKSGAIQIGLSSFWKIKLK